MEIRNDSAGSGSNRIDLTKANRDAIREQSPSPPKPDSLTDTSTAAKRIAEARGRFEKQAAIDKQVKEARAEASILKRVKAARAEFSVHKRVQAARSEIAVDRAEDKLTLSSGARDLAATAAASRPSEVADAARAQRVSELKALHQGGKLDTKDLVAEAAFRMLSGE